MTKQMNDRPKIRSVSDGRVWWAESTQMMTEPTSEHFTIRSGAASAQRAPKFWASASLAEAKRRRDGSAWGWGPTRIK